MKAASLWDLTELQSSPVSDFVSERLSLWQNPRMSRRKDRKIILAHSFRLWLSGLLTAGLTWPWWVGVAGESWPPESVQDRKQTRKKPERKSWGQDIVPSVSPTSQSLWLLPPPSRSHWARGSLMGYPICEGAGPMIWSLPKSPPASLCRTF